MQKQNQRIKCPKHTTGNGPCYCGHILKEVTYGGFTTRFYEVKPVKKNPVIGK